VSGGKCGRHCPRLSDRPQREVLVRFDARNEQFILEPNGTVNIPALSGQVSFPLASVATVFYPSNPIQWVDDNLQPINPPNGVTIQRDKLPQGKLRTPRGKPAMLWGKSAIPWGESAILWGELTMLWGKSAMLWGEPPPLS